MKERRRKECLNHTHTQRNNLSFTNLSICKMDDDAVRRFISVCVIKFVSRQERGVETHEGKAKHVLSRLSLSPFLRWFTTLCQSPIIAPF